MRLGEATQQFIIDERVEPLRPSARTTDDPDRDDAGRGPGLRRSLAIVRAHQGKIARPADEKATGSSVGLPR